MDLMRNYFAALLWISVGLSIMLSPDGRVLRLEFAFGEYKYLAGGAFILIGMLFAWLIKRKKSNGE
jgi:hypothetical protein